MDFLGGGGVCLVVLGQQASSVEGRGRFRGGGSAFKKQASK